MTPAVLSLWAGFAIGLTFGAAAQVSGFCLTRGMHGLYVTGDGRKIRAFATALAIAILGSQAAHAAGLVDLRQSIYLGATLSWVMVAAGGLLFGYGMIAANGCGSRAVVLLAQGNLRSFVVLTCLGIAAYMTLTGVLAPLRTALAGATGVDLGGTQSLPVLLAGVAGSVDVARWALALLLAAALLVFAFRDEAFRSSPKDFLGGIVIGLLVPASWLATGWLGADDFDPVPLVALTFVAPIGETIQYAMIATGVTASFGVVVVVGVFFGSLAAALATRTFQLEGFATPGRMARSMAGGALMGIGGALALGCSIGQGLSGMSTLAAGSVLALGGILLGGLLGLRGPLALPKL